MKIIFLFFCVISFASSQDTNCTFIANCETCNLSSNACLSCAASLYLSENACFPCNSSQYNCTSCNQSINDSIFAQCVNCSQCFSASLCENLDPHCETCSLSQCFRCEPGYYLDFLNKTCVSCDTSCETCENSPETCLSCTNSSILYENRCYSPGCSTNCAECVSLSSSTSVCTQCNAGFFGLPQCFPCSTSCKNCSGPTENDCTACSNGTYLNKKTSSCDSCYFSCKECYGPQFGSCFSCVEGFYLLESACQACNPACETCFGPNENHCLSCGSEKVYEQSSRTCVNSSNSSGNTSNSSNFVQNDAQSTENNDQKTLIIALSVVFGVVLLGLVIMSYFFVKAKRKVNELKYLNNEILSKKSSVKLPSDINNSAPASIHQIPENKPFEGTTPLEHHDLIKRNENFDFGLEKHERDIEKIYQN